MDDMVASGLGDDGAKVRSFEEAKSILYGTISKTGPALDRVLRFGSFFDTGTYYSHFTLCRLRVGVRFVEDVYFEIFVHCHY